MGNVPSKEPQGRPVHKLSKPRNTSYAIPTYTATPAAAATPGSVNSDGQLSVSRPTATHGLVTDLISIPYSATASSVSLADGHDDEDGRGHRDAQQDASGRSFLSPPKPHRRMSLFRSRSSQEPSGRRKSRRNTIVGSPVAPAPCEHYEDPAIGRANSVSTPVASEAYSALPSPPSRPDLGSRPTSWAYDLSSYEAQRILNLVQESPPPLPRSQTMMNHLSNSRREGTQTPPAWRRASIAALPESSPVTRSNSEVSLHPPMRRRSLIQTPGVATRTAAGPIAPRSRRSSLRHSHPPSPSMSRQSSFEIRENRFLSLPPLHAPHPDGQAPSLLTPQDTDYGTTGAFKFGTLRITNGSPVMTPKMATVSEGQVEKSQSVAWSGDYFAPAPVPRGLGRTGATDCVPASFCVQPAGPQPSELEPASSVANFDPVLEPALPAHLTSAPGAELGRQYGSELQSSPVELHDSFERPPASPELQTQSKQAAVDDDLFEDDNQTEISAVEVLDVRIDLNAKGLPPPPADSTQIVTRTDSGFVSNSKSTSSQSGTSLAKADSGYSSNISLRSLRNGKDSNKGRGADRNSAESNRELSKAQSGAVEKVLRIQPPGGDDRTAEDSQSDTAPTPPPKDDYLMQQPPQSLGDKAEAGSEQATPAGQVRRKPTKQQPANIDTSHVEEVEVKTPESVPHTPASVKSDGSSSSLTIGNSPQRPGRLQRFLSLRNSPFSKQSYTVHTTHDVDAHVPAIPREVEDKLREHTGMFPITTKRLALKSQMSKETLKTILSVGSLEFAKDEDDSPPTPSFPDEDEDEDEEVDLGSGGDVKEKSLFLSVQSGFKNAAASMMPNRKPIVRKPVPTRRESRTADEDGMLPAEAQITGHSWVNSSLGSNAYDTAATTAVKHAMDPDRSMTMPTGRDHHLRRRTHSFDSTSSSTPDRGLTSLTPTSRETKRPEKRISSPPVSMATRASVRMPPPRSSLSPKGPVVPREGGQGHASAQAQGLGTSPSDRLVNHRTSLDAALQAQTSPERRFHLASSGLSARHESPGSQRLPAVDGRHRSVSSTRSDFLRESRSLQSYSQSTTGPALKHRTSLEGFGGTQSRGAHVPQPAHQGPASWSSVSSGASSRYWNPHVISGPADSGMHSGQLAWTPPYVPRGSHRRNLSTGSRPSQPASSGHAPYRILHSYNSPAYRNAPIWG